MKIRFRLEFIHLPLRYEWKLSRNTSTHKINGLIRAWYDGKEGMGEIAPNIRYAETPDRVQAEFQQYQPLLESGFYPSEWSGILASLDACQTLKTGLDMAFQNLMAETAGIPLWEHLQLARPSGREICYTLPVMDPVEIGGFMTRENLARFSWLKVKVNRELALPMVEEVLRLFPGPVAIDGNEAWADTAEVLEFASRLPAGRILFLEQPLPSSLKEAYPALKAESPLPIWGDESVLGVAEPEYWKASFDGINVKLMKAGSLPNAIHLLKTAKSLGLKTMVGCMVETSLGISAALQLESLADYMDLDGFLVLRQEPFQRVLESDGKVDFTPTT